MCLHPMTPKYLASNLLVFPCSSSPTFHCHDVLQCSPLMICQSIIMCLAKQHRYSHVSPDLCPWCSESILLMIFLDVTAFDQPGEFLQLASVFFTADHSGHYYVPQMSIYYVEHCLFLLSINLSINSIYKYIHTLIICSIPILYAEVIEMDIQVHKWQNEFIFYVIPYYSRRTKRTTTSQFGYS